MTTINGFWTQALFMISIYIRTKLRSYWRSGRYFFCTRLSCTNIVRLGLLHFNCSLSWRFLFLWPSSLLSHHIVRTYQSKVSHVISHAFFTHTNTRTSLWFNNSLSDDPFYQLLLIHFQSLIACSRNDRNLFHFPQAFFSERCKFAS